MFKQEMCIGINEATAKKVLKVNGWLVLGEDDRVVKRMGGKLPDGSRPRMMHFKADVMHSFDDES